MKSDLEIPSTIVGSNSNKIYSSGKGWQSPPRQTYLEESGTFGDDAFDPNFWIEWKRNRIEAGKRKFDTLWFHQQRLQLFNLAKHRKTPTE